MCSDQFQGPSNQIEPLQILNCLWTETQPPGQSTVDPQTGTATLTLQNTWYPVFAAYTSTDYVIEGDVSINFPAAQTYEVRATRHNAARDPSPPTNTGNIAAGENSRPFVYSPTEYLLIEVQCTTAAGQVVTYDRCFKFAENLPELN